MKKTMFLLALSLICSIILYFLLSENSNPSSLIYSTNSSIVGVYENNQTINIDLYFENDKTTLNKKDEIETSFISDQKEKNKFSLNINEIIKKEEIINSSNNKLYKYRYEFTYPNFNTDIYIKDAYLTLKSEYEESKIKIGTINFLDKKTEELDILGLYGITNLYNDTEYLAAICLKIDSNEFNYIKDIKTLDDDYIFDLGHSKYLLKDDFNHNLDLSTIYDDYDLFNDEIQKRNIKVEDYYLLIPIKYQNLKYLDNLTFLIEIDDMTYHSLNFNYYNVTDISNLKEFIIINEIYNI